MKIIADENIPYLQESFGQVAEVEIRHGRHIVHTDLINADALIVRSVTPVRRKLLEDTAVRFVGSCTIGIDHVDTQFLEQSNIAFSNAPGSNADSAAEYTLCALLVMAERVKLDLSTLTVGIVGCGNVGSRVRHLLQSLGCQTRVCDPLLEEQGYSGFVDLDEVLQADVVTFHVPLTSNCKYPTLQMIDADLLSRMPAKTILINTARGDLIVTQDLIDDIANHGRKVVLDVWPNEPSINATLLSMVQIATPHIAGYSFDGKLKGTEMVYQAFCTAMGLEYKLAPMPLEEPPDITISEVANLDEAVIHAALSSYNISMDDNGLRGLLNMPRAEQGAYFDSLRSNYPLRREFSAYRCVGAQPSIAEVLEKLGFQVST